MGLRAVVMQMMLLGVCCITGLQLERLPDWYTAHRTHAHTRLAVNSFCRASGNASASSCAWSPAVHGHSPGSVLGHVASSSLVECQRACCNAYGCEAIVFTAETRYCALLDRLYNSSFEPSASGTIVANILVENRSGGF